MSYWCAEVCNTLTNILFLWLGCRGVKSAYKNSHPSIFIVAFLGYTVVGLGSSLFHATLKCKSPFGRVLFHPKRDVDPLVDPMQLIDELSMIYTTCFMCYATFAYSRSIAFSSLLGTSLAGLAWFITVCIPPCLPACVVLIVKLGKILSDQGPSVPPRRIYRVDYHRGFLQYVYNGI